MAETFDGATDVRSADSLRTPIPSRFAPGTLLADRYRIVAQLGRGGMGEVFRADDLKLGHSVALKFLPSDVMHDRALTARLLDEVRIGRQVSHPNVCRIYDVVEWEGTHFLTMEYVDGEDLSSLLRRIGRLPVDKAAEISRDIASGLAAAHDLGVVHRDLKPANVMVDGRGRARITDFGLAALAEDLTGRNGVAGTPAYMAPEQLRGEPLTWRSDVYALGLVIFEVFTGHRLFDGSSIEEIRSQRSSQKTPSVSSVARDVDPIVERVIDRCLQEDPALRPSAHGVIASLPGGDPLAAAVAAGETPSPAMVAAAGAVGDLRPAVAWSLFALALAAIAVVAVLSERTMLYRLVGLPKSTEVLHARAEEIAERMGYSGPYADAADEWIFSYDYLAWWRHRAGHPSWREIAAARPGAFAYVARFSSRPMIAWHDEHLIWLGDPPLTDPGMINVTLDPHGHLVRFVAVPPDRAVRMRRVIDWVPVFAAANLDAARFHTVASQWSAQADTDDNNAWDGTYAEQPSVPVHVEGTQRAGRIMSFSVYGPWDAPRAISDPPRTTAVAVKETIDALVGIVSTIAGIVLAWRNVRRGRGDRRGAMRVAALGFCTSLLALLFRADHRSLLDGEWDGVVRIAAGKSLYTAALLWVLYVALEPIVRRRWPNMLISCTRLISGRFRDPMVGRDLLAGTIAGLLVTILGTAAHVAPAWFGGSIVPMQSATSPFASIRHVLFFVLNNIGDAAVTAIFVVTILVIIRAVVRNRTLAVVGLFLLCMIALATPDLPVAFTLIPAAMSAAVIVFALLRFGVLSVFAAAYVAGVVQSLPIVLDPSAWYFGRSLLAMSLLGGLALYGAIIAIGRKPLFGAPLFDEE